MAENNKSICQNCTNSVGLCPWSSNLVPIKGWKAKQHKFLMRSGEIRTGYEVLECPFYSEAIRTFTNTSISIKKSGELWSDDEINLLLLMRKQRLQHKTIAAKLGRSEVSVRKKINNLKRGK